MFLHVLNITLSQSRFGGDLFPVCDVHAGDFPVAVAGFDGDDRIDGPGAWHLRWSINDRRLLKRDASHSRQHTTIVFDSPGVIALAKNQLTSSQLFDKLPLATK